MSTPLRGTLANARTLWHTHHQFVDKYAPGLWAHGEPRGEEIQRLVRVVENYGPRHERIGYIRLTKDGQFYRLTWKGTFLMTWRGLWPVSRLRRAIHHHATVRTAFPLGKRRDRVTKGLSTSATAETP